MQDYDPATQPFHTTNALLAYCLHLAGVPWEDNFKPCHVFYSENILLKFKNGSGDPLYKGVELKKAVTDAQKTGRRGHIEYVFQRVPRLTILIDAYQKQEAELAEAEGTLDDLVTKLAAAWSSIEPDVAVVKLACICLKMRPQFMDIWKHQIPLIMIPKPGQPKRTRETFETRYGVRSGEVVTSPGYKIVSLNAGEETLKHLGLT